MTVLYASYCSFDGCFAELGRRGGVDRLGGGEVVHGSGDCTLQRRNGVASLVALGEVINVFCQRVTVSAQIPTVHGDPIAIRP